MAHIEPSDEVKFRVGLGGNYYAWCTHRDKVHAVAGRIGRAASGVYWRGDFGVWVLRVDKRRKREKAALKALFDEAGLHARLATEVAFGAR